jgi:SAM-dependent methyltransferase
VTPVDAKPVAEGDGSLGPADSATASASKGAVGHWRTLWDEAYAEPAADDPQLNLAGWASSYTGLPIPAGDMREWVEATVGRILSCRPLRVLEIGCGTGMLLLRVAPECESYTAIDFAPRALAYTGAQAQAAGLTNVRLLEGQAHDLPLAERERFDLVILNSVIQYFPDAHYLLEVALGAGRRLVPGGALLLGDVRSRALNPLFQLSILRRQADPDQPLGELASALDLRLAQERELTFDPADLATVAAGLNEALGRPARLSTQLKRGRRRNELTLFRYDALLRLDGDSAPAPSEIVDWQAEELNPSALRRRVVAGEVTDLAVENIPNARLVEEVEALRLLRMAKPEMTTAADLEANLRRARLRGVEPEELWALERRGADVEVDWQGDGAGGLMRERLTSAGGAQRGEPGQ